MMDFSDRKLPLFPEISCKKPYAKSFLVRSPNVRYHRDRIESVIDFSYVKVFGGSCAEQSDIADLAETPVDYSGVCKSSICRPYKNVYKICTLRSVPKVGVMIVGLGGNNGSTFLAGLLANKHKIEWETKQGYQYSNWYGSLFMSSTARIGYQEVSGEEIHEVFAPLNSFVPMVNPNNDLVVSGWDVSFVNMYSAIRRAQVLDLDLQKKLEPFISQYQIRPHSVPETATIPLPGAFITDYVAFNQEQRANSVIDISNGRLGILVSLINDINNFKISKSLDKVIVVWSATTEKITLMVPGVNDTAKNILRSIVQDNPAITPSTLYAVAAILTGCSYVNGAAQNTLVPGVIQLAKVFKVFVGGNDFKSGQTKLKSVLVDFLVAAGIRPVSIVSYNHLGNNDGLNLSSADQFRSKEITKSTVVDDIISSNKILYKNGLSDGPDHCVVIKYVPYVGDSKRAMDEYTSQIYMGGHNTIVVHNTCEDSLLAAPIILDLIMITELCDRIYIRRLESDENPWDDEKILLESIRRESAPCYIRECNLLTLDTEPIFTCIEDFEKNIIQPNFYSRLNTELTILGYMFKSPVAPPKFPVVNALFAQRDAIVNLLRACVGLPPDTQLFLGTLSQT